MEFAMQDTCANEAAGDLKGSSLPRPLKPPPPTCWPFVTAVGLTSCFWGALLDGIVFFVGATVFVIGMAGLLGDWVREHRDEST
jgi:hypothetical protein